MKRSDGITVLSVYHFLVAALSVLGVCASLGSLLILMLSRDRYGPDVYIVLGLVAVLFFIAVIANAVAGWALFKMLEWGRWLSIALGVHPFYSSPWAPLSAEWPSGICYSPQSGIASWLSA